MYFQSVFTEEDLFRSLRIQLSRYRCSKSILIDTVEDFSDGHRVQADRRTTSSSEYPSEGSPSNSSRKRGHHGGSCKRRSFRHAVEGYITEAQALACQVSGIDHLAGTDCCTDATVEQLVRTDEDHYRN